MSNSQTPEPTTERTLRSSVRNPRRRPRQSDADSVKTAPRRKRSKISENTFVPPRHQDDEEVNGTIVVASPNGDIHPTSSGRGRGRPRKDSAPMLDVEMPVRGKKSSVKRPTRGDGAAVLTQNSMYSVKLLPSTPKELRREGVEYRGSLGAAHHALAVTRERAYIWDYTAHTPVNSPRVFDVPFPVRSTDALPFGALVTTGTGTDVGLIIVSATTGKIVFYESIERAACLGLFQERSAGVEGSLGSVFSGETVIDLISADHAGFIITLSSGRIAQLTLRDAQGKARVFAQFLRATEQSTGGLFGSIKGILGGAGWKRDVAAVHTRALGTRGQMQVISLTERAEAQIWDLDWSGRYNFKGTIDCREVITQELRKLESPEMEGRSENVTILDFAILQKPSTNNEITTLGTELPLDLAVLLRNGPMDRCGYVLAEIGIEGSEVAVTRTVELDTYLSRGSHAIQSKPRLMLPKPRHTAFIAFADAIVLSAMDEAETDSPEAQLHASYVQPANFEDSVYLKQESHFVLLSACEEEGKTSQASSIAFVKGAGLVRISVADLGTTERQSRIPIKMKLEQAVFHGALQDGNIIDFSRVDDGSFSPEDVERAALEISNEILRSTSPFISTSPTSIDTHLAYKAQALRALATHVRQNYPRLSRAAMWRLLWDAEKVAAAQQMWKAFEEHVAACSQKKRTATVMDEVCALVQQDLDPNSQELPSENDTVRTFFIQSLHRIEKLLPMAYHFLKLLKDETDKPPQTKIRLVIEADDLWNRALETVFAFRTENAAAYGILPKFIGDGVLTNVAEYTDLPEFWTSTATMLKAVEKMCKISRDLTWEEYENNEQNPEMKEAIESLVPQVRSENPRLIELLCLIYQERINWLASRQSEKDREMSEKLRIHFVDTRYDHFRAQVLLGSAEAGIKLAEKHKDMHTLTDLVVAEMQFSLEELDKYPEGKKPAPIQKYMNGLTERISKYFERFGGDWANAFFDSGLSGSRAGVLFRDAQEKWPDALTRYLRAEPSRAKMCWINDITTDLNFAHANQRLTLAAKDQETRLWAKKMGLSMSKLVLLAKQEELQTNGRGMSERELLEAIPNSDLEIVEIQEQVYQHLVPEIEHCIDQQAELEVSMQKFALKNQDLHSLKQLLEAGLERILAHLALSAEELIDVLTLMDSFIADDVDNRNMQGQEFYLSLRVLNAAAPQMPQGRFETLLQLIWKRCYVYDDWIAINSAQKQSDEYVDQRLRETVSWRTLFYAIDQDFFNWPNCHVRHLMPSECLGAGCLPGDLVYRWPDPDILDPILHDNKIQDEQLHGYVTDRRLDEWIEACVASAKSTVREEAEDIAQKLQREREFEASEDHTGVNGIKANGHAKGPNGIKVEEDGEQVVFSPDEDEDEDVEMA